MSEDESYIVKKRDLAEIIRTENSAALEEFLKDPLAVIAGAITDSLVHGPKAFIRPAVRIAQGVLKGKLHQQFAQEIKELREKAKLRTTLQSGNTAIRLGLSCWASLTKNLRTKIGLKP